MKPMNPLLPILICLLFLPCQGQTGVETQSGHIPDPRHVKSLVSAKEIPEAEQYLAKSLKDEKLNMDTLLESIEILIMADKFEEAAKITGEAMKAFPDHPGFHARKGVIHLMQNHYEDAAEEFTKELVLNPGDSTALKMRLSCHYNLRKYHKVLEDCTLLMKLEPGNLQWLQDRADTYLHMEKYAEAMEDYDRLLRIDESNNHARQGIDFCHERMFKGETQDR